jgi:uncharacterized protein (DUF1697 family)
LSDSVSSHGPEPLVALLRGINVGGRHKVPMADLQALFRALGCPRVETLVQSGNVVFLPPTGMDDSSAGRLAATIEERFGFPVPVVLRRSSELRAAVDAFPYWGPGVEPKHTRIGFLGAKPTDDAIAALDPNRSPGDRFTVIARDVHMHLPNGGARSKLTVDWFERRLKTLITLRNLRSVARLTDLCAKVAG